MAEYYFDTEFDEDGRTIELISIGLVCDDGREYYAISDEFDPATCNSWVQANVLPLLEPRDSGLWRPRAQIRDEIAAFVAAGAGRPAFYAWCGGYDWVALCQLFGAMVDLPAGWPKFAHDLKSLCQQLGNRTMPKQADGQHNALADARWNRQTHTELRALAAKRQARVEARLRDAAVAAVRAALS